MYYRYDCVNPKSLTELEYIIDHNRKIKLETFIKYVDTEDFHRLCKGLGYSKDFSIREDWHVSYHKGKLKNGKPFVYMQHSGIEYVFY